MRDRERELWSVGGRFLSHSEDVGTGMHSLSIQRLDALIYVEDKKSNIGGKGGVVIKNQSSIKFRSGSASTNNGVDSDCVFLRVLLPNNDNVLPNHIAWLEQFSAYFYP